MFKLEDLIWRDSAGNCCAVCGKTVRLYKYICRCGSLYCPFHRFTDRHNCTFDYESHGVEPLTSIGLRSTAEKVEVKVENPTIREQHQKEVRNESVKRKRYHCAVCRTLVGLYGHKCQCGGLYCSIHRLTDRHDCTFDYESNGGEPLASSDFELEVEQPPATEYAYLHCEYTLQVLTRKRD